MTTKRHCQVCDRTPGEDKCQTWLGLGLVTVSGHLVHPDFNEDEVYADLCSWACLAKFTVTWACKEAEGAGFSYGPCGAHLTKNKPGRRPPRKADRRPTN